MADISGAEPVQRLGQGGGLILGDQLQAAGQLGQVPEHGLGLTREGVEARVVEIGGGEGRVIVGQEAPRTVVEALARHVQIVGVQHAVDEARRDPAGRQPRRGLDHGGEEARRVARRDGRMIEAAGVLQQDLDLVLAAMIGGALEGPETDMAVRQPHHDGGARRRRLVVPLQLFAGLDQRQDAAGWDAQALQHGRRQGLAHPALQRQPPVRMARPGRLSRTLGAQIQEPSRSVPHLRRQEAAPVADLGIVNAELVAVIAHGHGIGLAGQGLEAAEMGQPFGVAQGLQPHRGRRAVVAQAQDGLREGGRLHRIAVVGAQGEEAGLGAIGGGHGHGRADAPSRAVSQPRRPAPTSSPNGVEPSARIRIFSGRHQASRDPSRSQAGAAPARESGRASVDNLTPRQSISVRRPSWPENLRSPSSRPKPVPGPSWASPPWPP
ncbi:hypothetical protein D3C80_989710 [compost metagenome]